MGKNYGVVARRIEGKSSLRGESYLAWDLEDFKRIIPFNSKD